MNGISRTQAEPEKTSDSDTDPQREQRPDHTPLGVSKRSTGECAEWYYALQALKCSEWSNYKHTCFEQFPPLNQIDLEAEPHWLEGEMQQKSGSDKSAKTL